MDWPLSAVLVSRVPNALSASDELEHELGLLLERAREQAPGVELDPLAFLAHVADCLTFDQQGRPVVSALHAGDLWVAFGCVSRDSGALATFEKTYAPAITGALTRSFEAGLAQDAELRVRERLMLVHEDDTPLLASYAGRGDLRAWLRAAAVRTAIDLMRARRELPVDPTMLGEVGEMADPLLASLKQRYRDEFRTAFGEAASALTDRDRTLLRYRFLDDLSIDEIGALYRVHRATVARWLATIRESLFEATRARLMDQLTISDSEADSVLRLIDSQLDVSIEAMIR